MTKHSHSIPIKKFIHVTYLTWDNTWKTLSFEWDNIVFEDWRTLLVKKEWHRFFIEVLKNDPIFLDNRELFWYIEIKDNDVIRLDDNTSTVLVRFRNNDTLNKSVYEISTDSYAIAKESKQNAFVIFIIHFLKQFFKHASILIIIITFWAIVVATFSLINLGNIIEKNASEIEQTRQYTIKTLEKFSKNNAEKKSNNNLSQSYKSVWIIWSSFILKDSNNQQVTYATLFKLCKNNNAPVKWNIIYDFYWTVFVYEKWKIMTNKHVIQKDLKPIISDMKMYWCNLSDELLNWIHFEQFKLNIWFPEIGNTFTINNVKLHPKFDIAIANLEWDNIEKLIPLKLEANENLSNIWDEIINIWYPAWTDLILSRATETFDQYSQEYNKIVAPFNSPEEIKIIAEKKYIIPNISQWIIGVKSDYVLAFDGTNVWWNSWWPLINKNWNIIWIAMSKFGAHETLSSWLPVKLIIAELNNIK